MHAALVIWCGTIEVIQQLDGQDETRRSMEGGGSQRRDDEKRELAKNFDLVRREEEKRGRAEGRGREACV